MAIGRITGPMLVPHLERQGIDLYVEDGLLYLNVTQKRVGVNTKTPNVELDVVGRANISSNLYIGGTVTVGNLYRLPTEAPTGGGQILTSVGYGYLDTVWAPGPPDLSIRRRKYETTINGLLGYGSIDLVLNLGVSSIVYSVSVSRPVKIEIFGTPERDEPNPYTFIATPDHLTDDGVVVLNDGSSYQSRQYSIFSNLEEPAQPNVYATISSLDPYEASTPITLSLWYFPAVTDSRPAVDISDTLPLVGYEGKMIYNTTDKNLYIWANGSWNHID